MAVKTWDGPAETKGLPRTVQYIIRQGGCVRACQIGVTFAGLAPPGARREGLLVDHNGQQRAFPPYAKMAEVAAWVAEGHACGHCGVDWTKDTHMPDCPWPDEMYVAMGMDE